METCKVCGSTNNKTYYVKELMFGTLDQFEYFQCNNCKCLQISDIPENLSKYYPNNYYSFNESKNEKTFIEKLLMLERDKYALLNKGIVGKCLCKKFPPNQTYELIRKTNVNKNSRILDVGCGDGQLLHTLNKAGFLNILGIDPFIEKDQYFSENFSIKKATISDLNDKFDLIMFNHSLEHMENQLETLQKVKNLISENGICLIRIPTVSSYVWEKYGVNWVELDAPRHLFLHSLESINVLAENAGLKIVDIEYDSTEFELLGSEQYLNGISQNSERSYSVCMEKSIFSDKQINEFIELSKKLNRERKGGRIAVFIKSNTMKK